MASIPAAATGDKMRALQTDAWKELVQTGYLGDDYMDSAAMTEFLPTMHEGRLAILTAIGATP